MSSYTPGAISALLGGEAVTTKDVTGLFSTDVLNRFQRSAAPEEFDVRKKVPVVVEEAEDIKPKKEKKRKRSTGNDIPVKEQEDIAEPAHEDKTDVLEHFDQKQSDEKNSRTIFVGNVPLSFDRSKLLKFFQAYGETESIRMRSVPVAGTAVDEAGNQNLVKKVCANSKLFGDQKGSYNAYIVYKDEESVEKALQTNNHVIDTRHIRVDRANPTLFDQKRTVFIGSLAHYTDEEALREHFAKVNPAE